MKRNAIVRICVYAGLILVLLAILMVGAFGMGRNRNDHIENVMSEAAVPVTMPVEDRQVLATGKTKYDLDLFVSPTSGSLGNGRMIKGTTVNILEIITTNGEDWAYVSRGEDQGWVQLPLLELDGETVTEETIVVSDAIGTATATEKVNIRSNPSKGASVIGQLDTESPVSVYQIQEANGAEWAYIGWGSNHGWVKVEYLAEIPTKITERHGQEGTATVKENLNLRASPSKDAATCGMLPKGSQPEVTQIITTSGVEWAYVSLGDDRGWAVAEYLDVDENFKSSLEDAAAETETPADLGFVTVTTKINVRKSHDSSAQVVGTLSPGEQLELKAVQDVNGISWGYISDPVVGWFLMKYVEPVREEVPETVVTLLEEGEPGLKKFHQKITALDISWPSGQVTVEVGDVELPEVRAEDGTAQCMVTDKGRLKVEAVSKLLDFKKKDVTVVFPENYEIEKLELDLASASAVIRDLPGTIQEVEIDTASGACSLENLTIKELEIDSASGPVSFVGSVDRLDFEGERAALSAVISNHPKKMELTNEIGKLVLTMPQDFGFTAENKGKTGGFMTDFTDTKPGSNVYGDGSCKLEIDNPHGSIDIRKAEQ